MKQGRRIGAVIVYLILGSILIALGIAGVVDEFWCGMGTSLVLMGVLYLIHFFRLRKDEHYREREETERNDERNRFLRNKAWAWAGYLFVLVAAVCALVFRVMGQELLSVAAGFAVALIVLLYWISYVILRKRY
jgi:Na+/melibiose symporter-like transporter